MNADTLAGILETLVDIPSETGHEAEISEWVRGRLGAVPHGETVRSGHAVVWRGPQRDGRPHVVLAGHLDTVPAQGNTRARRDDGRLHGLGATDMKGGDAVLLALIETLDPDALRVNLTGVFYDAEEGPRALNGLTRLLAEMPFLREADLAILLEPTDLRVEMGCNGALNAEVRVKGKTGHSARPWSGVNAIERAASWLADVTRFPATPVTIDGMTFHETLQVTTLKAGTARNVIPGELVANLNYRFPPDRTVAEAEARVRALVPAEFETTIADAAPAGKVCATHPEVRAFVERFGVEMAGKQGWTDVAQFTEAGVPAFNFGPGIPELSHQADEYCPIDNLETAYRWLAGFLTREGA